MGGGFLNKAALAVALILCSRLSEAFWRLPCRGRSGVARIDPLISPGSVSSHVHVIHGASNFAFNVDQQFLRQSSCTSCAVIQDKSAYWTPALYFEYDNGTTTLVEQVGGMLVYYLLYGENIQSFPNNFRMIAGDSGKRNFPWAIPDPPKSDWLGDELSQFSLQQKAIGFNCLDYDAPPESSLYRHYLPDKGYMDEHCKDGIRFELMFPSCWNGKDVDSSNHKSHMAYPNLVMTGNCPDGFETRLVSLLYETIWNTYVFKGESGRFVISNGDHTGFGYHGDFVQGWDPDFLQEAIETCTSSTGLVEDCPLFDLQDDRTQGHCHFEIPSELKGENPFWDKNGIPGLKVPIQSSSGYADHGHIHSSLPPAKTGTASIGFPTSYPTSSLVPAAGTTESMQYTLGMTMGSADKTALEPEETTYTIQEGIKFEVVVVEQQVVVVLGSNGSTMSTRLGALRTRTTSISTSYEVLTKTMVPTQLARNQVAKKDQLPEHRHLSIYRHGHGKKRHL